MPAHEIEALICLIASLDREGLARYFETYQANFPVDFTPEFIATQPLDRLRHIFLAICLQSKRLPDAPMAIAA
ncbi:MAG TPA: hypothetical protein VGN72_20620 [Tepidisphaeraceae bacterium]|jgi:hypothetical protein|nr:hypothetical protein [Tepidisphaeraceae bacterium]